MELISVAAEMNELPPLPSPTIIHGETDKTIDYTALAGTLRDAAERLCMNFKQGSWAAGKKPGGRTASGDP